MQNDDRFQFQSWYVRWYRWLRYQPFAVSGFCRDMFWWLVVGAPRFDVEAGWTYSRLRTVKHMWTMRRARAALRMRWYQTTDELIAKL